VTDINYEYWQRNGLEWLDEYDRRRRTEPYFVLQEILVVHMVSILGARFVLEYGAGTGRHLRNLHKLPHVECFAYEQSPSMTEAIDRTMGNDYRRSHVTLGAPDGALPFAQGKFDVSFTSEVLIHCSPKDVPSRLRELVRVTNGLIFHLEPHRDYQLETDAHGGCWYHDLIALYKEDGIKAVSLGRPFQSQELIVAPINIAFPASSGAFVSVLAEANEVLRPTMLAARKILGLDILTPAEARNELGRALI
jgi:SAM-dependent methyltransferase